MENLKIEKMIKESKTRWHVTDKEIDVICSNNFKELKKLLNNALDHMYDGSISDEDAIDDLCRLWQMDIWIDKFNENEILLFDEISSKDYEVEEINLGCPGYRRVAISLKDGRLYEDDEVEEFL